MLSTTSRVFRGWGCDLSVEGPFQWIIFRDCYVARARKWPLSGRGKQLAKKKKLRLERETHPKMLSIFKNFGRCLQTGFCENL